MKTKEEEQNFFTLLRIARENGFEIVAEDAFLQYTESHTGSLDDYSLSMDKFITEWFPDKVSFIEALCSVNVWESDEKYFESTYHKEIGDLFNYTEVAAIVHRWGFYLDDKGEEKQRPSSERLTWLFKVFNHLL